MKFDRYGLHWIEGDIGLLVQENKVDHVLGIPMNFDVTVIGPPRRGLLPCPHDISLGVVAEGVGAFLDDPLVQAMLPVPRELGSPSIYVESSNENKALVRELLRLSSTSPGTMRPMWFGGDRWLSDALHITNLSPLVLYGYSDAYMWLARKILETSFYVPRQLILMGPSTIVLPVEVTRIKPTITVEDVQHLPLESIGAGVLKQHMLRRR